MMTKYNPMEFGDLSRKPTKYCPIRHTICWLKLCPYAVEKFCNYPFIGRIKAEPDKVTE